MGGGNDDEDEEDADDANGYGYGDEDGTMVMQKDDVDKIRAAHQQQKGIQYDNLVSLFDGQSVINSVMQIPDHLSKQELLNINETLKQLFAFDQQKMKDYY